MQKNKTKEVSCRIFQSFLLALKLKDINYSVLLQGIPYDFQYINNKHERVEWSVYCKINSNLRNYFSQADFEEVGKLQATTGFYPEGVLAGNIFFSSNKLARSLVKQIFKMETHMFSNIEQEIEFPDKNEILVILNVEDGYEFCPEFFLLTKGYWTELGKQVGHKNFNIIFKWLNNGAEYRISWEKEDIIFVIKKHLRWLFSIRKAFFDLTDSHEALLAQYNQLEESKKLLQKQTTQLKTAYDITKSIRQSQNIQLTLDTITQTLVNDSEFTSAKIKLFNDIEGNIINLDSYAGEDSEYVNSTSYLIIINKQILGELKILPKIGFDKTEVDELMNYLLPVINNSVYDSLVLQSITDYKNNLEQKVELRTSELRNAQERLIETIILLKEAQKLKVTISQIFHMNIKLR